MGEDASILAWLHSSACRVTVTRFDNNIVEIKVFDQLLLISCEHGMRSYPLQRFADESKLS